MRLPLDEIYNLMRLARYRELYVLEQREAIIIHGILHQKSLEETNDVLVNLGDDKVPRNKA